MARGNWSVNLETEEFMLNRDLIVREAVKAVQETAVLHYVNLAVAHQHGQPDSYLVPGLKDVFGDTIDIDFVDQCGCGGYVYRVTIKSRVAPN